MLAHRTSRIASSPTMKGFVAAERLRQQGIDVVDLSAGEPDFPTPAHVQEAAHAAITAGFTKYTANAGTPELRAAVATRYAADYGVNYDPRQVLVCAGGKQALANATLALFGPGDEVVTHTPGWPTILEQVKLADATPVVVRSSPSDGFALQAAPFLEATTARTRGYVITSPGNPTGALMAEEQLAILAEAAAAQDAWVVLDLCYERLIYDPVPHNLPRVLADRLPSRAVLAGSTSKAYAMTGWRCGWLIGPSDLIAAASAIQSHSTSNASSISQKAAEAALTGPQTCVSEMLAVYRQRRDRMIPLFTADSRVTCTPPAGAFYLFLDVSALLSPDALRTSASFCDALLDEQHLVLTPGEAFDAPGFVRVSYAASLDLLDEAARRFQAFVAGLDTRDAERRRAAQP